MSVRLFAYVGVGLLVYASVSSAADSDARLADAARREDRSAIRALLADDDCRRAVEHRARATVEERYGWDAIARRQKRIYDSLLGG